MIVEQFEFMLEFRATGLVSLECGLKLGIACDAIGFSSQAVGQRIGVLDALRSMRRQVCPLGANSARNAASSSPPFCISEPGGLDQSPSIFPSSASSKNGFFAGHVLLEHKRMKAALTLANCFLFLGYLLRKCLPAARRFEESGFDLIQSRRSVEWPDAEARRPIRSNCAS